MIKYRFNFQNKNSIIFVDWNYLMKNENNKLSSRDNHINSKKSKSYLEFFFQSNLFNYWILFGFFVCKKEKFFEIIQFLFLDGKERIPAMMTQSVKHSNVFFSFLRNNHHYRLSFGKKVFVLLVFFIITKWNWKLKWKWKKNGVGFLHFIDGDDDSLFKNFYTFLSFFERENTEHFLLRFVFLAKWQQH